MLVIEVPIFFLIILTGDAKSTGLIVCGRFIVVPSVRDKRSQVCSSAYLLQDVNLFYAIRKDAKEQAKLRRKHPVTYGCINRR